MDDYRKGHDPISLKIQHPICIIPIPLIKPRFLGNVQICWRWDYLGYTMFHQIPMSSQWLDALNIDNIPSGWVQ